MTFKDLLIQLNACPTAIEWAGDMPIEEVVATCYRGDWLLWLAKRVDVDLRLRTLAKGHCANTVRYLMTDERSLNAVDVAIAFGEGRATREELDAASAASRAAVDAYTNAADDAAAYASAYAAAAAVADADDADDDADAAVYTAAAAAYAAYAALNRQQTANICRKYIGESLIEKVNQLLNQNE
jgi:hypothetical protein